jgi:gamma-glutamyl phosphate reductase
MRNYRHIIRSVKYYPRKHIETSNAENNITVAPLPKPEPRKINIETKIVKEVNNQTLDDFEAEYQAFIADLKAKKEREQKAKEEAEQTKMADDFESEYQAFIEELKTMKETDETSTKETIV